MKQNKKAKLFVLVCFFCLFGVFGVINKMYGGVIDDLIANFVFFVMSLLTGFVVILITLVLGLLTSVVLPWQEFITVPAVEIGWRITRDIVNLFFSVVLIVMAVGTIIGHQNYNLRGSNLARLVIMIVLVNFSKTICGVIIDFSQIVMLTFVNAIVQAGVGNFLNAVGITDVYSATFGSPPQNARWDLAISSVLAFIMASVALIVFIAMTAMLVGRIVMLWILVILSPLAYFGSTFHQGKRFHSQWWDRFTGNIIIGPVLAFFVYLAFATVAQTGSAIDAAIQRNPGGGASQPLPSPLSSPGTFARFGLGIGLLIGGIKIAAEAGGSSGVSGIMTSIANRRNYRRAMRIGALPAALAGRATAYGAKRAWEGARKVPVARVLPELSDMVGKQVGRAYRFAESTAAGRAIGMPQVRRALSKRQEDRVNKEMEVMKDFTTDQLMRVSQQGGEGGVAANRLLKQSKHLDQLTSAIEKGSDPDASKAEKTRAELAQKVMLRAFNEADEREKGDLEKKFLDYLPSENQDKIIQGLTTDDIRRLSPRVLQKASMQDKLKNIAGNKYYEAFYRFDNKTGEFQLDDGSTLKPEQLNTTEGKQLLESRGMFKGTSAQYDAIEKSNITKAGLDIDREALFETDKKGKITGVKSGMIPQLDEKQLAALLASNKSERSAVAKAIGQRVGEQIKSGSDVDPSLAKVLDNKVLGPKVKATPEYREAFKALQGGISSKKEILNKEVAQYRIQVEEKLGFNDDTFKRQLSRMADEYAAPMQDTSIGGITIDKQKREELNKIIVQFKAKKDPEGLKVALKDKIAEYQKSSASMATDANLYLKIRAYDETVSGLEKLQVDIAKGKVSSDEINQVLSQLSSRIEDSEKEKVGKLMLNIESSPSYLGKADKITKFLVKYKEERKEKAEKNPENAVSRHIINHEKESDNPNVQLKKIDENIKKYSPPEEPKKK